VLSTPFWEFPRIAELYSWMQSIDKQLSTPFWEFLSGCEQIRGCRGVVMNFLLPFGSFMPSTFSIYSSPFAYMSFYSLLGVSTEDRLLQLWKASATSDLSTPFWEFLSSHGFTLTPFTITPFYSLLGVSLQVCGHASVAVGVHFLLPFGSFFSCFSNSIPLQPC